MKADLLIGRLNEERGFAKNAGLIAVEVKPRAEVDKLVADLDKLRTYLRRASNTINCGILIYLSAREADQNELDYAIGEDYNRIAYAWIRKQTERYR